MRIFDNVMRDPISYRTEALALEYRTYDFGHCKFHGIAVGDPAPRLLAIIQKSYPHLEPTLTFFRKSPLNQNEPNYIHTDVDMGQWTGLLYMNPDPPPADGTTFWTHKGTGSTGSEVPHERSIEGRTEDGWEVRKRVGAKFNRLLLFPSALFHSRSIPENWGKGDEARLVQVVFGTGAIQ